MAEHEPDFKTVFPDIDTKVSETLTDGFDLWKWQYLFQDCRQTRLHR